MKYRIAALALAILTAVGAIVVFPAIVSADGHTLTVTPSTIAVGESAEFVATGCVAEGIPQEELVVIFFINGDFWDGEFTDEDGTAVTSIGPAGEEDVGVYEISAFCGWDPEEEIMFFYDPTPLTILDVHPTPPTTTPPTTTPPTTTPSVNPVVLTFTG